MWSAETGLALDGVAFVLLGACDPAVGSTAGTNVFVREDTPVRLRRGKSGTKTSLKTTPSSFHLSKLLGPQAVHSGDGVEFMTDEPVVTNTSGRKKNILEHITDGEASNAVAAVETSTSNDESVIPAV